MFLAVVLLPSAPSARLIPAPHAASLEAATTSASPSASAVCPRFICVPTHPTGGLGHRLCNVAQSLLISAEYGIPTLAPSLNREGPKHGGYPGAEDIFRIDGAPFKCPDSPDNGKVDIVAPAGWTMQTLKLKNDAVVDPSPGWLRPQLGDLDPTCRTIFRVAEFWGPTSYESVRPAMRALYHPESATAVAIRGALLYNRSHFNIALHVRWGDITPNPPSYFVAVLRRVMTTLRAVDARLPVDVWVFSESPTAMSDALKPFATEADTRVFFDTDAVAAVASFIHLMEADVVIGSDSSFDWWVSWISRGTPVVLAAPPGARPGGRPASFLKGENNILVDVEGDFDDGGAIADSVRKWSKKRRV